MLGYSDAVCAVQRARFGEAESSVPILMDNVGCLGTEQALDHCNFNGWGEHGCSHQEDAGVICEDSKYTMYLYIQGIHSITFVIKNIIT